MTADEAFEIAAARCRAARDSLVTARDAPPWENKPSAEAYDLAIDEVDKLVFAMRVLGRSPTNRQRWQDRVASEKAEADT